MVLPPKQHITILNICKEIKTYKKSITTIKPTGKDSDKENISDKEDSKNNMLFKTIKLFFGKESLFNSLNNEKLKLPSLPPLRRL